MGIRPKNIAERRSDTSVTQVALAVGGTQKYFESTKNMMTLSDAAKTYAYTTLYNLSCEYVGI